MASVAASAGVDVAHRLGLLLYEHHDKHSAQAIWRRLDDARNAAAAEHLGRLLAERGTEDDTAEALARTRDRLDRLLEPNAS